MMALYNYRAVTREGRNIEGAYNARDKKEVITKIREAGQIPVEVKEASKSKDVKDLQIIGRVKSRDIAIFCRQLYTMLNAGVTIVNCLDILRDQTQNKKLKLALDSIYEDVFTGNSFAESVKGHRSVFPPLLINMIDAGEASGNLDNIMNRMSTHYESEFKINNKIQGAMVYPMVLGVLSIIIVIFLLTFIMPIFTDMFLDSGVALPLATRVMLAISDAIKGYWYIIIAIIGSAIFAMFRFVDTKDGMILVDSLKLKLPVVSGVTTKVITARFSRTLSTLMASGVPLIQALDIVSRVVGNSVVEKGLQNSKEDVRKGISLSTPLERIEAFPPMLIQMIEIGEESGSLDDILEKTANFYDEEVEVAIEKMTTMIEPIMIILMAFLVGFIVIAITLPMFDMMNTIDI